MTTNDRPSLRASRLLARTALENAGKLTFKPVSSAKWTDVFRTWTGHLHVCIEHDSIRGVTAPMMKWWFANQARSTTWDGKGFDGPEISFYHLWHHRDHGAIIPVSGTRKLGFEEGEWTIVSEQFNDYQEVIHAKSVCDVLSESEFTFTVKQFGVSPVCKVIHRYSDTPRGLQFYAETVVGSDVPVLGWVINWVIVPFIYSKTTAEHWIKHNIEETGRSEDILPVLYERHREVDQ